MSLINQMLQDLDKRGAHPASAEAMFAHVSPTKDPSKNRWVTYVVLVIVSFALIAAGLFWFLHRASSVNVQPQSPLREIGAQPPLTVSSKLEAQQQLQSSEIPLKKIAALVQLPHEDHAFADIAPTKENKNAQQNVAAEAMPAKVVQAKQNESSAVDAKAVTTPSPAVSQVKAVKEISPQQQAESDYRQANILQQQGRTAEAIQLLEQTISSVPQHAAARQNLVALLIESKRLDDAIRVLQQGLNLDSNQAGLAMTLARLQVEKGDVNSAIESLQRTLPAAGDRADYLAFLAALELRQGHHKEAIDFYQRAVKKNAQSGVWWMGLGISLQADGRVAEALEAFKHAKSTQSLSPELTAFVDQKINQLPK